MSLLIGVHSQQPATIHFSFADNLSDKTVNNYMGSWGIGYFGDQGCQIYLEHDYSQLSPIANLFKQLPIKSKNFIAYTDGTASKNCLLRNSQPFCRQLWGKNWIFSHQGFYYNFEPSLNGHYLPVGETNSEVLFCYLLQELEKVFPYAHRQIPSTCEVKQALTVLAKKIAQNGVFNFLLSDGDFLFAYCSTELFYTIRQYPLPNSTLSECQISIDFNQHSITSEKIIVITSTPLSTNENWVSITSGQAMLFQDGICIDC